MFPFDDAIMLEHFSTFEGNIKHRRYLPIEAELTHIWVGNLTIIGLDNSLSPDRRQAIVWASAGVLLIRNPRKKNSEICIFFYSRKCI